VKRHRQSLRRRARNRAVKSTVKTAVKGLLTKVADKDAAGINASLRNATAVIAKAASKGVLHKKTAARKISRLAKKAHAAGAAQA